MKRWLLLVALFTQTSTACAAPPAAAVAHKPDQQQAMKAAIHREASEAHVCVGRIDYVGEHSNGAGTTGYIFYVYFADCEAGLQYERFIRVLKTQDGTLHVLTP